MASSTADLSASAAAAAAVIPAPVAAAAAALAAAPAETPSPRKRRQTPKIDIDAAIARHMAEVKEAAKLVHEARKHARNEKRKKQRLMKKAASLTPEDLERIAVLKRCGLWQPSVDAAEAPLAEGGAEVASGSSSGSPAANTEPPALPPPASPPSDPEARSGDEAPEDGE